MASPLRATAATLLVSMAAAAWAAPVAAQPVASEATPRAEVERLLGEVAAEPRTAIAAGKARALGRFRAMVPGPFYVERLEKTAAQVSSPLVQFILLRQAAEARLDIADFSHGYDGMGGDMGEQGCLVDWRVVGPFDNPSMAGFDTVFGPEAGQPGPYDGKMTKVDWRDQPDFDRLCYFNLDYTVEPSTAAVAYMATEITAERGGAARLLLGTDGAFKVWLNGAPVARRDQDLGLGIDGDAWPIRLRKGANYLLVKLASPGDGSLGLSARVTDPNLQPIADLATRPLWSGEPVAEDGFDAVRSTGEGLAAQAARTSRLADDEAIWAAFLWSTVEPHDAATPWRQRAEDLLEQAKRAPKSVDARELAVAADLFEEHWRRLDALELAHQRDPDHPFIALRLAYEYGSSPLGLRQLDERRLIDQVLAAHPDHVSAVLDLSSWYAARGFGEKALAVLRAHDSEARRAVPAWTRRLAQLTDRSGEAAEARRLYEQLERIEALRTDHAWRRIERLLARGEVDQALEAIATQQKLAPWSTTWSRRRVDALRATGEHGQALAEVERMLAAMPGRVALMRLKADLLVAAGEAEQAAEVVREATRLRPQDQGLREYLAFLEPEADRFYEPWMVADVRELAETYPAGDFSSDVLVDQTIIHVAPNGLSKEVAQRVERVITGEGIDQAAFHRVTYTTGDEQVDVLGVRVYKADGTVSEDYDQWTSGSSRKGATTYNDSAYVNLQANNVEEGDLVEFRYRVRQVANENFRGDYFGDISYVQDTRPMGLVRYVVHYPKSWKLYFRPPALDHAVLESAPGEATIADGYAVRGYELSSVPHAKTDPRQPGYTDVYDYVLVSNKKTYDEIGRWWWNLVKEQLIVDQAIRQKVAELTDGLETADAKVRAIHNYVVKNTRYLHVGLGIHGWKPYRTTTCFSNRMGDCKDKAALLKVMIEEAGVEANLVLVRTRRLGSVEDFPASMHVFNHAITYVPELDLYLDGTAEFNGTRELTPMDQGAQALIVKDGGEAEWVTLPVDAPEDNRMRRQLAVDLTGEEVVVRGEVVAHGQNAVYYRSTLEDSERRDDIFEKQLSSTYPGAELISATYSGLDELEAPVKITFEFRDGRIRRHNGGRAFIYPFGAPKDLLAAYAKQASRNQDLTVRVPFVNHTTMRYRAGATGGFEAIPQDRHVESPFGGLDIDYEQVDGELVVDIRYSIGVQRVPVADYPKFRRFVSQMTSALNETIRLSDEIQHDQQEK